MYTLYDLGYCISCSKTAYCIYGPNLTSRHLPSQEICVNSPLFLTDPRMCKYIDGFPCRYDITFLGLYIYTLVNVYVDSVVFTRIAGTS